MIARAEAPALSVKQILFATDFSPAANVAGTYARALALRFGACVEIATVSPEFEFDPAHHVQQPGELPVRDLLEAEERSFAEAGIGTHTVQSGDRPVGLALSLLQKRTGADLIVLGTHSKGTLDRFLIGSTAEYLIRSANCPVVTVGPRVQGVDSGPLPLNAILCATDLSGSSDRSTEFALGLAEHLGSRLYVCHVSEHSRLEPEMQRHQAELQERIRRLNPATGSEWCTTEAHGGPAQGILALAARVRPDLIVMGARETSFWLTHLGRGVTQEVLAHTVCPVLTLR